MGTSRRRLAPVAAGREAQANNFHRHYIASEAISAFSHAMHAAGIGAPDHVRADGALHRFKGDGGSQSNCWYLLHLDNRPARAFDSRRTDRSKATNATLRFLAFAKDELRINLTDCADNRRVAAV